MSAFNWYKFAPPSSGSFGREDMGSFCRVGNNLFIVPLFEASASGLSLDEVEAKLVTIQEASNNETVYELLNGDFTANTTLDWRAKLDSSVIS